jgi:O-antigen/teichoic acid export membrane protein
VVDSTLHAPATPRDDRMRLSEFVTIAAPLLVPWTLQLGSVAVLLLALPRILEPAGYADAAAASSLYQILTAGSVALQARPVVEAVSPLEPERSGWTFTRSSIVPASAVLLASPLFAALLDVPLAPLVLLAPATLLSLLSSGRIVGGSSSGLLAGGAGAVTRVVAGVALSLGGLGLTGVMVALLIAETVTFGIAWYQGGNREDGRPSDLERTPLRPAIAAVAGVALLAHLDVLFARYRLPNVEAGRYAGAAAIADMLLFVPLIAALVIARRSPARDGDDPFRWLHRSLGATGAAILVAAGALILLRKPVADLVLGPSFGEASSLAPLLVLGAASLAVVWQLTFFHVVVGSRAHVLILATAAIELVVLALVVGSPDGIAATAFAATAAAALLHYVGARAVARWSPPLGRLHPHEEVASPLSTPPEHDVELSMIVPCYNPGPALESFLTRLTLELQHEETNEVIVVSDGSTDDSVEVVRRMASPSIRVIHYPERAGKGHALRVGLSSARGAYVGFIDGDGDIDPQGVGPFLSLMRLYEPDVILGSKRHPMSVVSYPRLRRVMSWVYHKLTRALFRINVRDTQTGLKVIRRDVLQEVLPRMFEKRYAFDLELLVVARALGFTKVFEAPVRIDYRFSSNVNPDAVFRILLDTAAVFYRRYVLDTYRHAGDRLLLVRDADGALETQHPRA